MREKKAVSKKVIKFLTMNPRVTIPWYIHLRHAWPVSSLLVQKREKNVS